MGANPAAGVGAGLDPSQVAEENVSWEDAVEFCRRLSLKEEGTSREYRLPTEAEWEFACRAFTTTRFHFGDDWRGPEERANTLGLSANDFGLFDMHGNVWEWCRDWYDEHYYERSPLANPTGPDTGNWRVVRGGSWDYVNYSADGEFARSAARWRTPPDNRLYNTGFRVVAEIGARPQINRIDEVDPAHQTKQVASPAGR
jgi:formylglycine-generating enzyme required for sulfatase activity